jgi:hypothetical protein
LSSPPWLHREADREADREAERQTERQRDRETEPDQPISKPLRGHVTNGQLAKHDTGATVLDLLQLLVQDLPLRIHNRLRERQLG